jgi:hypothetical protein
MADWTKRLTLPETAPWTPVPPETSDLVTGQDMSIDGGYAAV